jgi:AraC family transcriptional regulator
MGQERTFKRYVLVAFASTKEAIENNPFAGKTTSQFAIEANINRKQLQAAFRAFTGMGIQEYQLTQRMEQSRQLLKTGNSTIKAIAINCGYKSQRAFTTAFKRSFGLTPSEFQNCPTE